jgi:hypothetical protein
MMIDGLSVDTQNSGNGLHRDSRRIKRLGRCDDLVPVEAGSDSSWTANSCGGFFADHERCLLGG